MRAEPGWTSTNESGELLCQGRCANQEPLSLLLPEVSYRALLPVVTFLYTGTILASQEDREAVMVGNILGQLR